MDELEKNCWSAKKNKIYWKHAINIKCLFWHSWEGWKKWKNSRDGEWINGESGGGGGVDNYFEMNLLSWFNFYFNSNNYFIINLLSDSAILNFTFFIWLSVLVFNFRTTGNKILISEWWTIIGIRWPNFAIQFKMKIPMRNCNVFRS